MLGNFILAFLCGYSESRRRMSRMTRGLDPVPFSKISNRINSNKNTLSVTLNRLKKLGLVENKNGSWFATNKGHEHFLMWLKKDRAIFKRKLHGVYKKELKNQPKNMIIVFDVPEKKRGIRDWIREELIGLGFTLLQKSVWFGPSPLPEKFIENISDLGALQYLKFFSAEEKDIA